MTLHELLRALMAFEETGNDLTDVRITQNAHQWADVAGVTFEIDKYGKPAIYLYSTTEPK